MLKLTSVKLLDNLYKKFKVFNLDDNFTLQKLVNRSMDLYVHNENFRKTINEWRNLKASGSAL
tara:strand:- start:563 stop:751 length:189 start_codon:yes stop_codon:yes gene_type:complete